MKRVWTSLREQICGLSVALVALMILWGGGCRSVQAQVYNPIVSYACSGAGVSACTGVATSIPEGVELIDLTIKGVCESGATPSGSQYAYADRCLLIYTLLVIGYAENDEVVDDCGEIDTIGEVDAEASISLVGESPLATTYGGEDCEGVEFESAPGAVMGSPC